MTATAACVAVLTTFATADRALDLHPITPPAGITDADRVLRVKAALAADPELRFVPLLVSVSDGVAVIARTTLAKPVRIAGPHQGQK